MLSLTEVNAMNFLANAIAVAGKRPSAMGRAGRPGSRLDFVQAMRTLGAEGTVDYFHYNCVGRTREQVQVLFMSCPRETWERVFGPPEDILEHRDPYTNMSVQTWDHECIDGRVKCVGHLFRRSSGIPWVVLTRILRPH